MKGILYKNITLVFGLLFLSAIITSPVNADDLQDKQQQLDQINSQIEQQQNAVNQVQGKENNILGQISNLDKSMANTQKDLNSATYQLNQISIKIKQTEQDILKKTDALNKQTDILDQRLVYIYEDGTVSYMEVLLNATSLTDFLTRYDMLKAIVDEDIQLIGTISQARQDLDRSKYDLESAKKEVEKNQLIYQTKQSELARQKDAKKQLLNSIDMDKGKLQETLNEMEQQSQELEQYIRSKGSKGSGSPTGTGKLVWPLPGGYHQITDPFGWRFHPILKKRELHTGEDIAAPEGTNIYAADNGTVIKAGWNTAYGNMTIIDHGNGLSTLYGHQEEILVSEGDVVKKGQIIGKVDSTGWSTGNHLHFQVNINGNPTDPNVYF